MLLQLRSQALTQASTDYCSFAASTITYPLPQLSLEKQPSAHRIPKGHLCGAQVF